MNAPVELECPTSRLKAPLASKRAAILPGTPNALFARVIEELGFEAVYITGAGIANMSLGVPDIGLVTLSNWQNTLRRSAMSSRSQCLPMLNRIWQPREYGAHCARN